MFFFDNYVKRVIITQKYPLNILLSMTDTNIVDDYYAQANTSSPLPQDSQEEEKKRGVKGKIKLKKLPKKDWESQPTPKEPSSGEKVVKKTKKIMPTIQFPEKKETPPETPVIQKTEEKNIPPIFQKKAPVFRAPFSPPDRSQKPQPSKPTFQRSSSQKSVTPAFPQKFTPGIGAKKTPIKKDEEKQKLFKKDKSNKYAKNIFFDDDSFSRSTKIKPQKKEEKKVEDIVQNLVDRTGETIVLSDIISVKEFSEKIGVPLIKLITEFMKNGMKVNINSKIDYETAAIIADAFQIKIQKDTSSGFWVEDMLSWDISTLLQEDDTSVLQKRAPIISIMGHVDHGKTSLLDYLRKTKIAAKEAGWITQSIGAYQVSYNGEKITFLDTPGHEAFTIMRARWAKSTDIAILVVAADEWVKPQTVESINHAREAELKIVVAITKIDKEWANIENVKSGLSSHGLLPEDWGGDVPMVGVSSKTGEWIDSLLEIILLLSEMENFQANPNRTAVATILESHLDVKLGPVSTLLINTGTLKKGDSIVSKWSYGKVKVMKNDVGKNIDSAGPSVPVLVVGLDSVCSGGDIIQTVADIEKARNKALEYKELMNSKKATSSSSIDTIMSKIRSGNLNQLKIVLKADTNGALEAIKWALLKLSTPETQVTIIHSGVGNITEWDTLMCQGSSAILIGFNVQLLGNTKSSIEDSKIEFISSKVIYTITEKIEKIITWMFNPKEVEKLLGHAKVWGIFYSGDGFMILWLKVPPDTTIVKWANVRILRDGKNVGNGKIENLKSGIIDVNDIEWPTECGIKLVTPTLVEMNDELEIFITEIEK